MKKVKFAFLSMVLLALSTVFMANKASAQTSTDWYRFNIAFQNGNSSTIVGNSGNYTQITPVPSPNPCLGGTYFCAPKVETFSGSAPAIAAVASQIEARYIANGNVISHNEVINVLDSGGNLLYRITLYKRTTPTP